jgi:uncharacterized protein (TIGR03067 family)
VSYEESGKDVPDGEDVHLDTVEKDKLTVERNGGVYAEGQIELDPTKSPKQLDFRRTDGRQTELTIYIRVGDLLIQCGHRDGKPRPTELATATAKGGAYLIVLQRQK